MVDAVVDRPHAGHDEMGMSYGRQSGQAYRHRRDAKSAPRHHVAPNTMAAYWIVHMAPKAPIA